MSWDSGIPRDLGTYRLEPAMAEVLLDTESENYFGYMLKVNLQTILKISVPVIFCPYRPANILSLKVGLLRDSIETVFMYNCAILDSVTFKF